MKSICPHLPPNQKLYAQANTANGTNTRTKRRLKNAPAALFRRVIGGRDAFTGFFCDNMISEMNYSYSNALEIYRGYKEGGK